MEATSSFIRVKSTVFGTAFDHELGFKTISNKISNPVPSLYGERGQCGGLQPLASASGIISLTAIPIVKTLASLTLIRYFALFLKLR